MAKPRKVSNIVRMPENRKPAYWRARPAQIIVLPMIRTGWDSKQAVIYEPAPTASKRSPNPASAHKGP
jgi:hypothetical protein